MMTGKKRALLALLLTLTMVFSVMFGTASSLAIIESPNSSPNPSPNPDSYAYIINVEYRYEGTLVRTGNQLTAVVGGLNPLDITVSPDASIIPAPYYLLGTDPKVVTVSPSNNVQTVVFELNSDEVPLAEPTTGTAPNMLLIVLGIALTIGAIGVSTVSFLKQKKSAK